jgi:DNA-binding MarR family transcriptional regulator
LIDEKVDINVVEPMSNATVPFRTTLQVRDHCLCLHVQRAARTLARRFDDALRPVQLSHGQFSLLMSLNSADPVSIGALAAHLAMDRTTLTANLKPLERRGLVVIRIDPTDRRGRWLSLTDDGHAALLVALPIWRRTLRAVERQLPGPGAAPLLTGLQALVQDGVRE